MHIHIYIHAFFDVMQNNCADDPFDDLAKPTQGCEQSRDGDDDEETCDAEKA